MYLNTLSNIGLAYIMQKKSFLKDDKPITYFEIIDCVYGFKYDYKNVGFLFTSLSKNLGTQLPTAYNSKNEYFAINFQSIEELSSKNNNVADIDKFLSEYKKNIGKFCFYIPDQNTFESISDQELIQQIEKSKSKEDFNGNLLKILKYLKCILKLRKPLFLKINKLCKYSRHYLKIKRLLMEVLILI